MKPQSATSKPTVPSGLPELLRPQDVARALSLSVPRIYQLAAEGKIVSIKMGKSLRFESRDVAEFIRAHRRERRGTP